MNEFIFKSYGNSKQSISYCEVDKCKAVVELKQQLDQLKAENETYKKMLDNSEVRVALTDIRTGDRELWRNLGMKTQKLKQTLSEIKEIAEANKKYIYVLPSYFVAGDSLEFSFEFMKNILNKISECEVGDET